MKKVVRKIEVELTKDDRADLGMMAAKAQRDYFKREIDFSEYKKNEKRKIDDLKSVAMEMLRSIDKGTKEIDVECDERPNLFEKEFEYIHQGEVVDVRKMALEEFDSIVEKVCKKVVNEDTREREYYFENKLVIARTMTNEQFEKWEESQRGQKSLDLQKE